MSGNTPQEDPPIGLFVHLLPQYYAVPILVPAMESMAQKTLVTLFSPEYISADGCQVSAQAVLHIHVLLHARLEATTATAIPNTTPEVEQVDTHIRQPQKQVANLELQN
jgi:hypothetical protein